MSQEHQSKKATQEFWKKQKTYAWSSNEASYVIDTPPPTVSGTIHMGHIFSYTQAEILARYFRQSGRNVFFPIGFDDNGLPTERFVEKERKIKARSLPREEFKQICREVIGEQEDKFENLFREMGFSFDWDFKYQTISPLSIHVAQMSFIDLINKGQVYQKNQPIFWDPVDQTALAQSELEDFREKSFMHNITFELVDGGAITIATTRPELLPACVCIFVHPDDARFKGYVGKLALVPLFGTRVQILTDEKVLAEKGTGAVMCCTFGDTTDVTWWKEHELDTKILLDKRGKFKEYLFDNESTAKPDAANKHYAKIAGLNVREARSKILELLAAEQYLVSSEEIEHTVKRAERSKATVEILITPQWFIKTIEHKEAILELAKKITWHPEFMRHRLDDWIKAISADWCISRQRFFGVPFPVWYSKRPGEEGKILLPDLSELPINPEIDLPRGYSREEVRAEVDVMDTWATSCVSPQLSSLGISAELAIDKERHKLLFPAHLRFQSHEIIRTWAFGTILKAYLHQGVIPWENIMISGWCVADDGAKMSKSSGNIIDPLKLLDKYGPDPIRYWASSSPLGQDSKFKYELLDQGKRLVNKLTNAAKFCKLHLGKLPEVTSSLQQDLASKNIFCAADLWLIYELNQTITQATSMLEGYDYHKAKEVIEKFFWQDFCADYLELIKKRVYNSSAEDPSYKSAALTMHHALRSLLAMLSPFIPFTTEDINLNVLANSKSINARGTWPNSIKLESEASSAAIGEIIKQVLSQVRNFKATHKLSMNSPLTLITVGGAQVTVPENLVTDLANVTCAQKLEVHNAKGENTEIAVEIKL